MHTQTNDETETDREPTDEEVSDGKAPEGLPPRPKNDPGNATIHSLPLRFDRAPRPQNLLLSNTSGSPNSMLDCGKELPSPSTVSLKLPATPLSPELGNKSSSAPVIMKQLVSLEKDPVKLDQNMKKMVSITNTNILPSYIINAFILNILNYLLQILKQPRSQSERHLAGKFSSLFISAQTRIMRQRMPKSP